MYRQSRLPECPPPVTRQRGHHKLSDVVAAAVTRTSGILHLRAHLSRPSPRWRMVSPTVMITPQPCEMRFMRPRARPRFPPASLPLPPFCTEGATRGWVRLLLQMCLYYPPVPRSPSLSQSQSRGHRRIGCQMERVRKTGYAAQSGRHRSRRNRRRHITTYGELDGISDNSEGESAAS